ncbi:MAG: DUF853 family protein, partial [Eudoraea sp.]|nr:DUF853 domain-containing protein [Eudoraea sp.]NNJ39533.1 DUF853 family protein [Eudoraea sp.]
TMLRAPMSRMDVLTPAELKAEIKASKLVPKYNEVIDRESAYELLNEKIERAESEAKKEAEREVRTSRSRKTTRSRRSTRQNPVIKVLTSATFIRGVLGIMKKVMR